MKLGLAFSGGKDSWACLYLARKQLKSMEVIWVNTGKAYPETLEMIELAREMCPNFHEVRTDQDTQNLLEGIPSDIVPIDYTSVGQLITHKKAFKVQSYVECCYSNIAKPLHLKAQELGISHLIRGQRNTEVKKGTARHGDNVFGIVYLHPIENWTDEAVMQYLEEQGMGIPEHFQLEHTSLDCYDCSGFWKHSADRMAWATKKHPELAQKHKERLEQLKESLGDTLGDLVRILEASNGI